MEIRDESVEIEDALNAGHCVEPVSDMQFCALDTGSVAAINASREGARIIADLRVLDARRLSMGGSK